MALVKPVLLQIAGYQDSGKTTVAAGLIERISSCGWKAVAIKHHGHGGKPAVYEGKDSGRHVAAGAVASIVEGGGRLVMHADKAGWSLEEQVRLAEYFMPEVVLVEGHKHAGFPKIVLLRGREDFHLLEELLDIVAVFVMDGGLEVRVRGMVDVPIFKTGSEEGYGWVLSYIENYLN
ncbi:molybdopterin-guanine dinucleotide biosynthesis protein B [Mesobacillus zeae]|uniref:Molybdopterin-guanine dinucleotide biosynthesis protein B n=1 Tax=Mesobacillus zeae TaxID=1917180 RepID=A0A398BA27_9BACI|nr:molybdopterin-guanine dinucleotide biosynthesis protein B [Mesobacillus zeae]RID84556.1 molybdopterin-guanine dinucleotide biosynthesis protein B [Mesobacillus zeae]